MGSASCAVCERWVTHRPIPDVHSSDSPSPRPWTCTAMTYKPLELQNPLSFPNVTCILTTTPAGDSGRDVGERAGELRCCEDMSVDRLRSVWHEVRTQSNWGIGALENLSPCELLCQPIRESQSEALKWSIFRNNVYENCCELV